MKIKGFTWGDWGEWAKKMRGQMSAPSLQRRNRGETIKKQLLRLNKYELSRLVRGLSTAKCCNARKKCFDVAHWNIEVSLNENRDALSTLT
jgi:hypothetical protein